MSARTAGDIGIPKTRARQRFGRGALAGHRTVTVARATLNRLAGHRDPAHVLTDDPILIGVAVVTRPSLRSAASAALAPEKAALPHNERHALSRRHTCIASSPVVRRPNVAVWVCTASARTFNPIEEFHSS